MISQKVCMWGNSLGIRLPQTITRQVGWEEGALVSISIEGDKIVLAPAAPRYTLEELLAGVEPDLQHDELDWGTAVGEESW
ncbi:MAG: AbrB/MazE/SpoVT family DNA-binding domain-containing protein [Cyanobacteria bacterium J06636_16]